MPQIRRHEPWQDILAELDEAFDEELDQPAYGDEAGELDDRREVFEVLSRGPETDVQSLPQLMHEGIRDAGKYAPPLTLLHGKLTMPFDQQATLQALCDTAKPFVRDDAPDDPLSAAVEEATRFIDQAHGSLFASLKKRIHNAFAAIKRPVPKTYLSEQLRRVLLQQRAYQKRELFGAAHLRGEFEAPGMRKHLPLYIPAALGKRLPLYDSFQVRVVALLVPREDQYESHPAALRLVAIARELPLADWS